jgi:hypothetical protein
MGQVEELMEMAEDEMIALDAYLSVRGVGGAVQAQGGL